jgi:hypothetical protein
LLATCIPYGEWYTYPTAAYRQRHCRHGGQRIKLCVVARIAQNKNLWLVVDNVEANLKNLKCQSETFLCTVNISTESRIILLALCNHTNGNNWPM